MIKGIIKQAVIDILREQNLIHDGSRYTISQDTQTRVENIGDVLRAYRKELDGLRAALEICYTDDEGIEKKYRHKKWNEVTKEERDLLCKRYDIVLNSVCIGYFIALDTSYIGDTLKEKKAYEEFAKQDIENNKKKAKKNARSK